MEYVQLNNGLKMPILGYGVYQVTKDECERCVLEGRFALFLQKYEKKAIFGVGVAAASIRLITLRMMISEMC